jgi:hypothetical protein
MVLEQANSIYSEASKLALNSKRELIMALSDRKGGRILASKKGAT